MPILPESFPGEKLAIKVFEELKGGVGVLTRPWITKRDEAAKAEAARHSALLEAQTQQDIERIKRGEATYEGGKLLSTTASGAFSTPSLSGVPSRRIEPYFGDAPQTPAEFMQAADAQAEVLKLERSLALHRITRFAEEEAEQHKDDSTVSDEPIDPDWFARWRASAQDIRSEHMQRLWAKILVGEAKQPRSYSIHTLDLLSRLSKEDAEIISRVAPYVIGGMLFYNRGQHGDGGRPALSDLLLLEEIGILVGVDSTAGLLMNFGSLRSDAFELVFVHGKKCLFVTNDVSGRTLAVPIIQITRVGREVLSLGNFAENLEYLKQLGAYIRSEGFQVKYCDYIRLVDGRVGGANCVDI